MKLKQKLYYSMDVSHSVYIIYMWHKVSFLNEHNKFNFYTTLAKACVEIILKVPYEENHFPIHQMKPDQ